MSSNSLPNGTVNVPYSVTLQSSGGTSPITWSTGAGLPSGLSLGSRGTISGTPTIPGSGCSKVSATDSSTPPQVVSQSLCIGVNSSDVPQNALLKGHYAFLINRLGLSQTQDFIQIAMTGSFVADGAGNITGGVSDTNGAGVGVQANQSFTGTYVLAADNRGTLSISSPTEAVGTYAFSVGSISASGVANKGHMIQFAAGAVTLAGELELQDPSSFSNSAVAGSYAFEWSGGTAGVFTADGNGGINTGTADEGVAANQPLRNV
jgi:large repetitive protein